MLDARFSHLYFYQSLNRLQRGLSAIAELLVIILASAAGTIVELLNSSEDRKTPISTSTCNNRNILGYNGINLSIS